MDCRRPGGRGLFGVFVGAGSGSVEGESRPSPREASQPPKEPCPCGVPSRCLVDNDPQPEAESPRPPSEEPSKLAPGSNPAPPVNRLALWRQSGIQRPEGCVCGTGLNCDAHD
jgi:hypothetical protein